MKKDYIKPRTKAIDIENCENLLQSSYMDIGGTTDSFNARRRDPYVLYDIFEEEEEQE